MNFTYKEWKKVYHANTKYEEAGVVVSVSEETDFKARYISREKERDFKMIKRLIYQVSRRFTNLKCLFFTQQWKLPGTLYKDKRVNPLGRHRHLKRVCTKQQNFKIHEAKIDIPKIDNSTIIAGDFNNLTTVEKTTNKDIEEMNNNS